MYKKREKIKGYTLVGESERTICTGLGFFAYPSRGFKAIPCSGSMRLGEGGVSLPLSLSPLSPS